MLGPERIKLLVELFSVTPVTLVPMTELIVVAPVPAPILVTVPVLLMDPVAKVIVPEVAFSLMVRLLEPVIPPLKVVEIAVPVLPKVKVPVVPVARTIALL